MAGVEDGSYTDYSYSPSLAITSERRYSVMDLLLDEAEYTYDTDGNRLTKSTSAGVESYGMSPGFQLSSITGPSGTDTFSFDPNGRVASMTRGGTTWALGYNSTDHLTAIDVGGALSEYAYDAAGRRVSSSDAAGVRDYLVAPVLGDGLEAPHLAVDRVTGAALARYVYGGEHALLRIDSAGTAAYYLEDAMGSVIGIADGAGALSASVGYDAFGNVRSGAGVPSETGGDFRFQGMWLDPSGLYHVRARHYDASTGRFVSRDPAEGSEYAPESWHPYMFANGNGNVWRDPTGLFSLAGLNISQTVQRVLRFTARTLVNNGAVDKFTGGLIEAASNVIMRAIAGVVPGADLGARLKGLNFEEMVGDEICSILGGFQSGGTSYFWREPAVNQGTGRASRGTPCTRAAHPKKGKTDGGFTKSSREGTVSRGHSFPDFLVTPVDPENVKKNPVTKKSWLTAELKLSVNNVKVTGRRSNQIKAILTHAEHWSASSIVFYLSFNKVRKSKQRKMQKMAAEHKAKLFVFSVL